MPLTTRTKELFRARYGVDLEDVSSSLEEKRRLLSTLDPKPEHATDLPDGFGRGHVAFGKNASARAADRSTRRIMSRWRRS